MQVVGNATPAVRIGFVAVAYLMAGCALQNEDVSQLPAASPAPDVRQDAGGIRPAPSSYLLTAEEIKLDCPKLTGRMRIKIANMRDGVQRPDASAASRTIQSALTPVMGGTQRGMDPTADLQRDRAKLEAYNKRLAEKKCKTLDLDAELRGVAPAAAPAKAAQGKS